MVKNKVYFVNHKLRGNSHEIIDVSLIVILADIFSTVEIYLSSSRTTILRNICHKYLTNRRRNDLESKLNWHKSKLNLQSLFWMDLFVAIKDAYLMLRGERDALYVFSYGNNRFSLFFVNFVSRITGRKVLICSHNELDVLLKDNYSILSNWHYLINRFYRKSNFSENLKILVLGDFIIDNLKKILPEERIRHFISIDHPYFQTEENRNSNFLPKENKDVINIGLVGSVELGSSMNNLLEFSTLIKGSNVYLNIISRMYEDSPLLRSNKNIIYLNPNNVRLSREEYDSMISKMDYLYYPHAVERFQYSASGSIFEAIAKRKPAIVYSNPNFTYLFKKYGRFGYLINSTTEIPSILSHLSSANLDEMIVVGERMMMSLDPLMMGFSLEYDNM